VSPNFLAASRMKLSEALETTEQSQWRKWIVDPTEWLRQMRFSPALASAILILGFAGGTLTAWKVFGASSNGQGGGLIARDVTPRENTEANIAGIHSITPVDGSNNVEITYDKLVPTTAKGDINDPRIQQLLLLASRSPDDIKLVLNAQGGQASDGEALFDLLRGVEARVLVIGAGAVAGAPALAFVAPPRAQRFCLPHARFSLFQRFGGVSAGADLLAAAQAVALQRERITRIFARQMGQPVEIVAPEIERQDWLDAEEALAHGLVERIVTGANAW